ncbi:IS630 family transposase [Saccharothrix luteola]|uniref:IS630 family transposase n=1 Tax=Saccharothrix luteola TaxID=2893018 RepID=UPI001E609789|nr:IS630 family transposase [Saccharothrix luteola]MCC8243062.1 IS630 family transposase [Saccharothrix luteola]
MASKGPSGTDCRLSPEQQDRLAAALEEGPAAHGNIEDQRWTLARVADLVARLFRVRYTLRGVSMLLHRMGFSPQMPAHRPVERDEETVMTWRREAWWQAKLAAERGAWICFEDEAGHTLRPPKARTWAPRGQTPVIRVSGRASGRISVAGLFCVRPGAEPGRRPHLLYRVKVHRARKGERRSFAETDYAALLDAAHQYLHAEIVVIRDNLNTHISAVMRRLVTGRDWLHVIQLPADAPDLNPTEGVWSHVKRSLGNLAVTNVDHLAAIVRNRLKRIQYRPDLLTGFHAQTGLTLEPFSSWSTAGFDMV